ncbi:MAG: lactate dehydrogenase [Lachnospiraceae bacterium]|nr:lactate dehydrogenase [Lachnospiraceae bacterium]
MHYEIEASKEEDAPEEPEAEAPAEETEEAPKSERVSVFFYCMRPYDMLPIAERYAAEHNIRIGWTTGYPATDGVDLATGYDAVCVTPSDMGAEMLQAFADRGVKYISCNSIGYDHVDLEMAKELGMRVSNVAYPPSGVANYAIMLMMMCQRRIMQIMGRAGVQDFSLEGKIGKDLSFSTVGVIGTGKIGGTVIRHLSGFGCRILCYDPYRNEEAAQYAEYTDLDTLFAESDIITLHTNATEENHHLLDAAAFAKMKKGVVIINTARGKLIDTDALIDAVESGKVGAAALDVLEVEDGLYYANLEGKAIANRGMAVLRSFPNVIMSPHTAFYTEEAVRYMTEGCLAGPLAFAEGRDAEHTVL